ncbi:hypothetical protein CDAR_485321 [Caerostris darwini]|uniref:Uncharacterized protein n=1 Tax=Caerostris darwini TaxID=1538125 RepID=A0AAV4PAX3_9ARAC|nr:hypothetical protein CDAR_485321 [Caerostris darwini]
MRPASLNILMPAHRPSTISEVLDKEGRLRARTLRHHKEGEAVTPFVHPSIPLLALHPFPQNFIMLPPPAQVRRRCCVLLSQTKTSVHLYSNITQT